MIRESYRRNRVRVRGAWMLLLAAGLMLIGAMTEPTATRAEERAALKVGLLMDFSGGSTEVLRDRQRAFELAIKHVNDGGGVFGLPVRVVVGDTTADPEKAVAEARRLIEVEGVQPSWVPTAAPTRCPSPSA